jgi:peptidyl-prolyl cis-trans isomerase C
VWAAGLLLISSIAAPVAAQPDPDTVVLTINDKPVHFWEVGIAIPQVQTEMVGRGMQPQREQVIQTAMKRVVDIRLLAQEAEKEGFKPNSSRVDATMAQLESQSGGREQLLQALQQIGVTYDQLRSNIAQADLVQEFIAKTIDPQVTVTADEVAAFYNENPQMFEQPEMVRARHILFRFPQNATQGAKDAGKINALAAHNRVVSGEDFAKVAMEVSEGPKAPEGGDLGFFARDQMVPVMTDAAFALAIGEISEILESQFGYHILKVEDKRAASVMPFAEAKDPLEKMLRENKAGEKVASLLQELNQTATIVEVPPPAGLAGESGGGS